MNKSPQDFDRASWIERFGNELEKILETASFSNLPTKATRSMGRSSKGNEVIQWLRSLAELAKDEPFASKLIDESHLWIDSVPKSTMDVLLEHPVFNQAWFSGKDRAVHLVLVQSGRPLDINSLFKNLAKLALRTGGKYAATRFHRFLIAGERNRLHAHEITVLYGLRIDTPIDLGHGAFLASYASIGKRFGLVEDPDVRLKRPRHELDLHPGRLSHDSSCAALVRRANWGPAITDCDSPINEMDDLNLQFFFPGKHSVDSYEQLWRERQVLLDLLSLAVNSKLVSHTVLMSPPMWMKTIDPNFHSYPPGSRRGVFDVWPKDVVPTHRQIQEYREAANGWLDNHAHDGSANIDLAIRRTVASIGIAGGDFGFEDRLVDIGVAMEAMYGPFGFRRITHKMSTRAADLLGKTTEERNRIFDQVKSFYEARSTVVHGRSKLDQTLLVSELKSGQELAKHTLFTLLSCQPIIDEPSWNKRTLGSPSA